MFTCSRVAKQSALAGLHGEALKLRLAAPAVEGRANACLVGFVAELLGVPKSGVRIISGEAARQKVVEVSGAGERAIAALTAGATAD